MAKRIGVVGNQTGWTYEFVEEQLLRLGVFDKDVLVSGGADGVDSFAQRFAKEHGNTIIIHYPKPHVPSPARYFQRNKDIVVSSDIVVAFDKKSGRAGTKNTIKHAKSLDKPLLVFRSETDEGVNG